MYTFEIIYFKLTKFSIPSAVISSFRSSNSTYPNPLLRPLSLRGNFMLFIYKKNIEANFKFNVVTNKLFIICTHISIIIKKILGLYYLNP